MNINSLLDQLILTEGLERGAFMLTGIIPQSLKPLEKVTDGIICQDLNCNYPQCIASRNLRNSKKNLTNQQVHLVKFIQIIQENLISTGNMQLYSGISQTVPILTANNARVIQKRHDIVGGRSININSLKINNKSLTNLSIEDLQTILKNNQISFIEDHIAKPDELVVGNVVTVILNNYCQNVELFGCNECTALTTSPFDTCGLFIFISGDKSQIYAKIISPGSNVALATLIPKNFDKSTESGKEAAVNGTNCKSHILIYVIPLEITLSNENSQRLSDYWNANPEELRHYIKNLVSQKQITRSDVMFQEPSSTSLSSGPITRQETVQVINQPQSTTDAPTYRGLLGLNSFITNNSFSESDCEDDYMPSYGSLPCLPCEDSSQMKNEVEESKVLQEINLSPIIEFLDVDCQPPTSILQSSIYRPELTKKKDFILPTPLNFSESGIMLSVKRNWKEPITLIKLLVGYENPDLGREIGQSCDLRASIIPTLNAMDREQEEMGPEFTFQEILNQISSYSNLQELKIEEINNESSLFNSEDLLPTTLKCVVCFDKEVQEMPKNCLHLCICSGCLRNNNHLTIHKCPICRDDAYEWLPYTKNVVDSLNGRKIYQTGFWIS